MSYIEEPAMKLPLILCLSLLAFLAEAADKPRNPYPTGPNLILEQAFGNRLEAMAEPAVAESEAKYLRNLYKALIAQGFSAEEAFEIVVHHQSLLHGN